MDVPSSNPPELVLIAAVAEANRVIGRDMGLPWHIPEDLKRFKRLTTGYPLLMGRRTFESLVAEFGGPLPNRRHIVLTSRTLPAYPQVECFRSLPEALAALAGEERVFIGGGQAVYEQTLPLADRLELTIVEGAYEGDTYFPPYRHLIGPLFALAACDRRDGYRFETYVRANG